MSIKPPLIPFITSISITPLLPPLHAPYQDW